VNKQRQCRNYRRAGNMFSQCIPINPCPEVRAVCCRCEGVCFVRTEKQLGDNGTTRRPCYGCVKEMCERGDTIPSPTT
jgi:hypothetical protein